MAEIFAETFASKSQAEWTAIYEGSDACVSPVLDMLEARHIHIEARKTHRCGRRHSRRTGSAP